MGYYSDVALGLKVEDYKDLWEREKECGGYSLLEDIFDSKEHGDEILLLIEGVKWYDGYEEVDRITDFLQELEKKGHPYSFLRIGEDSEDVERVEVLDEDGYSIEGLEVVRYITLN